MKNLNFNPEKDKQIIHLLKTVIDNDFNSFDFESIMSRVDFKPLNIYLSTINTLYLKGDYTSSRILDLIKYL